VVTVYTSLIAEAIQGVGAWCGGPRPGSGSTLIDGTLASCW